MGSQWALSEATHATEGDWMGVERGQRSYTRINNCNNIK